MTVPAHRPVDQEEQTDDDQNHKHAKEKQEKPVLFLISSQASLSCHDMKPTLCPLFRKWFLKMVQASQWASSGATASAGK